MSYLPYAGYWFYGAATDVSRASYFSSWGLLETASAPSAPSLIYLMRAFTRFFSRKRKSFRKKSLR